MGGWGRQNPWPFQWGGGKSTFESVWLSLRDMIGEGGPGAQDSSLEDAWRESKVSGIVKVITMPERAALQALPKFATDFIPLYQALLGVPTKDSEHATRVAVSAAWVEALSAIISEIESDLQLIDSDLSIVTWNFDETATFAQGLAFQSAPGQNFGTPFLTPSNESKFPTYSHHYRLLVLWENQPGGIPPADKLLEVQRQLNKVLPSWCDFIITTDLNGFQLDFDPLDYTSFGT